MNAVVRRIDSGFELISVNIPMTTLILSTRSLPASESLAEAARQAGWRSLVFAEDAPNQPRDKIVFYGGTDRALTIATKYHLALLEPPFDLLAKLPLEFRRRPVEFGHFDDVVRLKSPTFVKPADALNKSFDAGIYGGPADIRPSTPVDRKAPVLFAEPVEWSAEYRCFILNGQIAAWSPYISFGRPVWKPFAKGLLSATVPANLTAFCERLFSQSGVTFPPAFVMDIGLIDDRGWAVVEFNPVWCSGVLGAEPKRILAVLDRACQNINRVSDVDRRWVIERARRVV